MQGFWLCFVPLFVAVDAVGVLPIYLGLTGGLNSGGRRQVLLQSILTAALVAFAFLFGGPKVLALVGVGVSDFMVAGGLLLLVISLTDLITGQKLHGVIDPGTLGAVPIGVPLLAGPAVFTTSVLLVNQYGLLLTASALLTNILVAGGLFALARPIEKVLGQAGSKILSKVASLFLASIAVMLIRKGIMAILSAG